VAVDPYITVDGVSAGGTADSAPARISASADGKVLTRVAGVLAFADGTPGPPGPTGPPGSLTDGDYGDFTVTGGGTTATIDPSVVTDSKLRNSAGLSVIGRSPNTTGQVGDITAAADGDVLRRSGTALGFGAIPESSVTSLVSDLAGKSSTSHDHTTGAQVPEAGLDVVNAPADRWIMSYNSAAAKLKWITTTVYPATSVSLITGTLNAGSITSFATRNDADIYDVQEVTGVPGIDVRVSFANVAAFNLLRFQVDHIDGTGSHKVEYALWNVVSSTWDLLTSIRTTNGFIEAAINADDFSNYIDTGASNTVICRMYHPISGVGSHQHKWEYMVLVDSVVGGGGISDHAGLSGLDVAGSHPATAVSNAPAGTIAATDVQAAIDELDAEKVPTTRTITFAAPGTGGGDLSANRTLDFPNFVASGASHARGAVPDPGATPGATKFLREDATWATPSGGAGSGAAIRSAIVNVPTPTSETTITVTDALITSGMLIIAGWGAVTDDDENGPGMDDVSFSAVAGTGNFALTIAASDPFVGDFRINYTVA
jgi:hypothetical protein